MFVHHEAAMTVHVFHAGIIIVTDLFWSNNWITCAPSSKVLPVYLTCTQYTKQPVISSFTIQRRYHELPFLSAFLSKQTRYLFWDPTNHCKPTKLPPVTNKWIQVQIANYVQGHIEQLFNIYGLDPHENTTDVSKQKRGTVLCRMVGMCYRQADNV